MLNSTVVWHAGLPADVESLQLRLSMIGLSVLNDVNDLWSSLWFALVSLVSTSASFYPQTVDFWGNFSRVV